MIADVYSAVKSRLELNPVLAGKVHPSARLEADGDLVRSNYVILYPPPPILDDGRVTKAQDINSDATFMVDGKVVAVDALGCAFLADAVLAQMVGHKLVLSGRRCDPAKLDDMDKVRPDNSVSPPLFFCDISFEIVSRRA